MTAKHTPGPWGIEEQTRDASGSPLLITDSEGGRTLAEAKYPAVDYETAKANARLIAIAPELLAMLKLIRSDLKGWTGVVRRSSGHHSERSAAVDARYHKLCALISKAEDLDL